MPKLFLLFFIVLYLSNLSKPLAQNAVPDTGVYRSAINNIIKLYLDSAGDNLQLYNGTEFISGYRGVSGHPFFEYSEPQQGDIFYNGVRYPGMMLSYDLIHDEVIFADLNRKLKVKLNNEEIDWFTLQNHSFVHLREDANLVNFPGNGFYELLYEGAGSVLAKRKKQLYESSKADEASRFTQWNTFFVRKNNIYHSVDSKRSLLAVCGDHKTEAAKFMQKENLNFKKDPANTIIRVIAWYTQFKN